eukprot:scaffold30130_cov58-Attheya_sp.AAC.2
MGVGFDNFDQFVSVVRMRDSKGFKKGHGWTILHHMLVLVIKVECARDRVVVGICIESIVTALDCLILEQLIFFIVFVNGCGKAKGSLHERLSVASKQLDQSGGRRVR